MRGPTRGYDCWYLCLRGHHGCDAHQSVCRQSGDTYDLHYQRRLHRRDVGLCLAHDQWQHPYEELLPALQRHGSDLPLLTGGSADRWFVGAVQEVIGHKSLEGSTICLDPGSDALFSVRAGGPSEE